MEDIGNTEEMELSTQELQIISELDSRQFGFMKLNESQHAKKKNTVERAIKCLERILLVAANSSNSDSIYEGLEGFTDTANAVNNAINSNKSSNNSTTNGIGSVSGSGLTLDPSLGDNSSLLANIKTEPHTADDVTVSAAQLNNGSLAATLSASHPASSILDTYITTDDNTTDISTSCSSIASLINNTLTITNNNTLATNNNTSSIASLFSGSGKTGVSLTNTPPPSNEEATTVDPETYCKLGHFHLLLEDYPKAMSAYQKYYNLRPGDYWKNATFLYGHGLVYFYFHAFQWAIKAFQQVLYIDSSFSRANEVHLRLGLMFKVQNDFEASLKHFQLALLDSGQCSFTKLEIRFHEAHLYELQGKHKVAQDAYDKLLKEAGVSGQLRADILRQLGWMHHTVDSLGDKRDREEKAVNLLQKSIEADPKSGQSLYLLGRCLASLGRIHDAFLAYRNSVDKCEGNADTWCSIGVLYQQQNQPIDALQAYICAVQFDKTHVAAWTNLGILYESCSQPRDALTCYLNASRSGTPHNQNPNLALRTRFLQQQLAAAPMPSLARPKTLLLTIEEAWNLPVAADMNQRGGVPRNANTPNAGAAFNKQQSQHAPPPPYQQHQDAKRFKSDAPEQPRPQYYLSTQQIQMLHYLQQNQNSITPQQQQQLQHLQHNYRLMQQHQVQLRQQQQQQQQQQQLQQGNPNYGGSVRGQVNYPAGSGGPAAPVAASGQGYLSPRPHTPQQYANNNANAYTNGTYTPQPQQLVTGGQTSNGTNYYPEQQVHASQSEQPTAPRGSATTLPDPTTVSDQELQELISQKEFTESFAEDLLNRLAKGENVMDELNRGELDQTALPNTQFSSSTMPDTTPRLDSRIVKQEMDLKPANLNESGDLEGLPPDIKLENSTDVEVKPSMLAAEILAACRSRGTLARNMCMLGENHPPPCPPEPPNTRLNKDQLVPPTASVLLENKKLAFSPQLQEFCLKHPIAVVRGLASALKMDLGLFSTKTLVQTNPEHNIEVRTQAFQPADKNLDPNNPDRVTWPCYSHRSHTTIAKYAHYQANSFQESLKEEQDRIAAGGQRTEDSKNKKKQLNKMLKFGTNVDLSDDKKWRLQLQELQKLPAFTRVVSAGNMLSHVGHPILGMNTVQLYMKVPGARTPGHQENNNFCSININIGPGDCEWFAVPDAYWGVIANLCEKNGTNYLHGSWWPDLKELFDENVPVYRFLQKPGDMVWVNSGCVHWVQAVGWCNNIAWNVGPLTARQYQLGLERYEWNKLQRFKSIVPMLHLTWNLARNIKVSDGKLFDLIKMCLVRSLRQVCLSHDFVKMCAIEVKFHGRARNEASHYCGVCELEVFNVLFVREIDRRHVVHCIDCARRISQTLEGFVVLEEYHIEDLMEVYDQFILHAIQSQSIPGQAPTPPPSSTTPTPSALAT